MPQPDYLISTPENVDLHLELAGLGNRALACLIDTVITWLSITLVMLSTWLLVVLIGFSPITPACKPIISGFVIMIGVFLAFVVVNFGYYIYFEALWHGQTPGKRIAHIRVIEQNGQPVSISAVVIRNLIRIFDTGVMLIGLLPMLIDKHERRFGDLAAGTLVIRERLPHFGVEPINLGASMLETNLDVGKISPKEYEILLSFLRRRDKLAKASRAVVAHKLATYFQEKLTQSQTNLPEEEFLEMVCKAYQSRALT